MDLDCADSLCSPSGTRRLIQLHSGISVDAQSSLDSHTAIKHTTAEPHLFLLAGATGSGKSTLLEGIVSPPSRPTASGQTSNKPGRIAGILTHALTRLQDSLQGLNLAIVVSGCTFHAGTGGPRDLFHPHGELRMISDGSIMSPLSSLVVGGAISSVSSKVREGMKRMKTGTKAEEVGKKHVSSRAQTFVHIVS